MDSKKNQKNLKLCNIKDGQTLQVLASFHAKISCRERCTNEFQISVLKVLKTSSIEIFFLCFFGMKTCKHLQSLIIFDVAKFQVFFILFSTVHRGCLGTQELSQLPRLFHMGYKPSFIAHSPHGVRYKTDNGVRTTKCVAPDPKSEKTSLTYLHTCSRLYRQK